MTRKLSLTTAIAVAALGVGVPTAVAADRQPDGVAFFYANERATLVEQPVSGAVAHDSHHVVQPAVTGSADAVKFFYANERATMGLDSQAPFVSPDTLERIEAAGQPTQSNLLTRSDSAESAIVAERPITRSDSAESAMVAGSLDAPVVSTGNSGTEIEWPQVGIGLGIGILLGLGLWLALRFSRIRPLAH
jgi:hypothetical protein